MRKAATVLASKRKPLKTFALTFALIHTLRLTLAVLKSKKRRSLKRDSLSGHELLKTVRTALFPVCLPALYQYISHELPPNGEITATLPALLSSPLLALLPSFARIQLALIFASAALLHTAPNSKVRARLPPVWTLNILANAWLLWAFLYERETFPKAYERVVLMHSRSYVPKGTSIEELISSIRHTSYEPYVHISNPSEDDYALIPGALPDPQHKRSLCAKLHPHNPSCLSTYLHALVSETRRAATWFGAWNAAMMVLTTREKIRREPLKALKQWTTSTLRSALFIAGNINTSWAMTCLLQRLLSSRTLPRLRWFINGSVPSFLILLLPEQRRADIALYAARTAALSAWQSQVPKYLQVKYGEIVLFALAWAQLVRIKRNGGFVGGISARIMRYIEGQG